MSIKVFFMRLLCGGIYAVIFGLSASGIIEILNAFNIREVTPQDNIGIARIVATSDEGLNLDYNGVNINIPYSATIEINGSVFEVWRKANRPLFSSPYASYEEPTTYSIYVKVTPLWVMGIAILITLIAGVYGYLVFDTKEKPLA